MTLLSRLLCATIVVMLAGCIPIGFRSSTQMVMPVVQPMLPDLVPSSHVNGA